MRELLITKERHTTVIINATNAQLFECSMAVFQGLYKLRVRQGRGQDIACAIVRPTVEVKGLRSFGPAQNFVKVDTRAAAR